MLYKHREYKEKIVMHKTNIKHIFLLFIKNNCINNKKMLVFLHLRYY